MAEEKKEGKTKRPTAQKRDLQSLKRNQNNRSFKARVTTALRAFEGDTSSENLKILYSLIDKGVKKGIYKLNKAGRLKTKCSSRVA